MTQRKDGRLTPCQAGIVKQWAEDHCENGLSESETVKRCLLPLLAEQEDHIRELVAAVFGGSE